MAEQEGFGASEVVSSVVVLRHGARAVSRNAFAALRSWESGGEACGAVDQWARHLDRLSMTGSQQMHRLGEWLTGEYLSGRGGEEMRNAVLSGDPAALAWFSSPVDRVVRSGSAFWAGCRAASRVPVGRPIACPEVPAPMLRNGEDASDELTRPWAHSPAYTEAMTAWKRGPQLAARASKLGKQLEVLHSRALGLGSEQQLEAASPTVTDATSRPETPLRSDGSESVGVGSLEAGPLRLYQTTYLLEVMECERYWTAQDDDKAVAGAAPEPGGGDSAVAAGSGADARPATLPRSVLPRMGASLWPRQHHSVAELSRWVWEARFFSKQAAGLGRPLLGRVFGWLGDAAAASSVAAAGPAGAGSAGGAGALPNAARITTVSAHDYTLLSLLAALRVGSYPSRVVAFCAFLLFELRRWKPLAGSGETETRWTIDVYLNTEPFPFARGPEGGPKAATQLSTAHMERIISDLPLESAQYLVGNTAPARPASGYGAMGTLPSLGEE